MITEKHSIAAIVFTLLLAALSIGRQPAVSPGQPAQASRPSRQSRAPADGARAGASISGKLLVDGQPLAGVNIVIRSIGSSTSVMETMMGKATIEETGDDGRFSFDGLRSAAYVLRPMLTGYVPESGLLDAGGQQIYYRPGDFASIRMVKGGVITGRVVSDIGSPLTGIAVRGVRIKDLQGRHSREVTSQSLDALQPLTTDDRGVYRIYGLEDGIYLVCAGGAVTPDSSGPFDNEAPVYHPGGPISTAIEIAVHAGQESSGIDISYQALAGHTISGTLNGRIPSGTLFSGAAIMLSDANTGSLQAIRLGLGPGEAGDRVFVFSGVADGRYEVTAVGGLMGDEMTAATPRRIVVQGGDVTGIDMILGPLAEISGQLVLETSPIQTPPEPKPECAAKAAGHIDQSVIQARTAGDQPERGMLGPLFSVPGEGLPNEKGEFKVRLISSGTYYILTQLPGDDLYVHSMSLPPLADGRPSKSPAEGLDIKIGEKLSGVTITLARGAASLSGRVVPPDSDAKGAEKAQATTGNRSPDKVQGAAASDPKRADKPQAITTVAIRVPDRLQVIAVPAEQEAANDLFRYAGSPVNPDGSFAFSNLAPGRYYLITRVTPDAEWSDPELLPGWFNVEQRKQLHRNARKASVSVELNRCAAIKDYELRYSPAPPPAMPPVPPKNLTVIPQ